MKPRLFAVVLACALALALSVAPALAHAELLRSIPDANAALDRAPAQIELFFSEPLESSFSAISVLNADGARVDNADSRVDPLDATRLTVSLRSLPDGVYTVSWKALSSVDGHVTVGAFPFAVGDVDAAALAAAEAASRRVRLSIGEVIARWMLYLSAAALAGGTLFVLVVWGPAWEAAGVEASDRGAEPPPWGRLAQIALILLVSAQIFGLLVQAGQASGAELAMPGSSAITSVVFNTRFGALWIARLALALGVAGLLPAAEAGRDRWIAFGLSAGLLLVISLGSHAAAEPRPALPVLADWVHLLAASAWVGGLTHFALGLWSIRRLDPALRARLTARLLPRFSALALLSVGALALTGVYSAVLRVGSFQALEDTLYGRTLVVKLIIALPMVMLGAVNLLAVTPNMKRAAASGDASGRLVRLFRRIVTGEVALGAFVLLSAGVLTALPPAQTTSSVPALTDSARADDLQIALEVTPGRVGLNTFAVEVTSGGQPVDGAREVALRFTPASGDVPPSEATLAGQGQGRYAVKGSYFSLPDRWQVQVAVRREGKFDSFANFDFDVGAPAAAQTYPWNRVSGALLLGTALAYIFAFGTLGQTERQLIAFGLAPAFALALVSVTVFFRPPLAEKVEPVNPIPPNAQSVAAGKALYETNCVPCHGPTGKGDGPVGLTLSPRPADLSLHAVPGVHTDGQLFEWIADGFPGSVMPPFGTALTEEQVWHLVNFMRTLAPKP